MNLKIKNSSDNHQKFIHCIPNCIYSPTVLCSFCCYQKVSTKRAHLTKIFVQMSALHWEECKLVSTSFFHITLFQSRNGSFPLKVFPLWFLVKILKFLGIELLMMPKTKIHYQNPIYGVVIEFELNLTKYRLIKDN